MFTPYKHGIQTDSITPTGDAGLAINQNFQTIGNLFDSSLVSTNNLSDVSSPTTARTNLGLGTAATHNVGDFAASTALSMYLLLAGGALSGKLTGPAFISSWVTLTYASTLTTDASTGANFEVTLTANTTFLANPTNATDGQIFRWRLIQDSTGGRTLTLGTLFNLGSDLGTITLSSTANKTDYLTAVYRSSTGKFDVTGFLRGF